MTRICPVCEWPLPPEIVRAGWRGHPGCTRLWDYLTRIGPTQETT